METRWTWLRAADTQAVRGQRLRPNFDYARTFNRGERVDPALEAAHEEFISTVYETEHPLVRVHPETSERSLVLGGFARTVLGFTPILGLALDACLRGLLLLADPSRRR